MDPASHLVYRQIPTQNLSDFYRLMFENRKAEELTDLFPEGEQYAMAFYDNKIEEGFLPFEKAKEKIRGILIKKKRNDLLSEYTEKLKTDSHDQ